MYSEVVASQKRVLKKLKMEAKVNNSAKKDLGNK